MRIVAITFALLTIVALLPPTQAADECAPTTPTHHVCVSFQLKREAPPPAPAPPASAYWGTYYLWVGPGLCGSPTSNDCRGTATDDSGVPQPCVQSQLCGEPPVGGFFGVLYQESNGVTGLQRGPFNLGGPKLADRIVLV